MKAAFLSIVLITFLLSSCQVVGSIFGAGVYTGVFVVVLIIGFAALLVIRAGKNSNNK